MPRFNKGDEFIKACTIIGKVWYKNGHGALEITRYKKERREFDHRGGKYITKDAISGQVSDRQVCVSYTDIHLKLRAINKNEKP